MAVFGVRGGVWPCPGLASVWMETCHGICPLRSQGCSFLQLNPLPPDIQALRQRFPHFRQIPYLEIATATQTWCLEIYDPVRVTCCSSLYLFDTPPSLSSPSLSRLCSGCFLRRSRAASGCHLCPRRWWSGRVCVSLWPLSLLRSSLSWQCSTW